MASLEEHFFEAARPDAVLRLADQGEQAVAVVGRTSDLGIVREPHVALALWERDLPAAFQSTLDRLDLDAVDDVDLAIDLPAASPTLAASLIASGYPERAATPLAADMLQLGERLAALAGETRVRLRLEVVETDSCRKFHADYVTLRLLVTYRGPATQWIRAGSPDTIEQVERGAAAVFKGRLMLEEPTILHRSPPIAATGEQRLLLTIDTPRQGRA